MTAMFGTAPPAQLFTPRLAEGSVNAPRVVFLDFGGDLFQSVESRIADLLKRCGEVAFAINRYAIHDVYRRLGKERDRLEIPHFGAPAALRSIGFPVHSVFVAMFPPAWETGEIRSYALSSPEPTTGLGIQAHKWLVELGPSASNRLLWSDNAS